MVAPLHPALDCGSGSVGPAAVRHGRSFLRRFARHRPVVVAAAVLAVISLAAILAPWLAPYPLRPVLNGEILRQGGRGASWDHWLGTDELGRDVLTGVLFGARTSLTIGFSVALASTVIGTVVGLLAGWFGRWTDSVLMRLTDLLMVIPGLALVMIVRKQLGASIPVVIVALSLLSWHVIARVVRAQVRSLIEMEFVEAARASGAPVWRIVVFELLPNLAGVLAVNVTLTMCAAILAESTLSFLGFGFTASWGTMLAESKGTIGTRLAYLVYVPGLAILVTVLAVNFVGNGLRDAFDAGS